MVRPVQDIAIMIEQQDAKGLSTLPGIGAATAEKVIATLRRKMPRFALLVRREAPGVEPQKPGLSTKRIRHYWSWGTMKRMRDD